MRNQLKNIGYIDTRALSLFRIFLGLFFLGEFLLMVLPNFGTVYSPETGILGECYRVSYEQEYDRIPRLFSVQSDGGMRQFIGFLVIVLIAFTSGLYPRLMAGIATILLWLFFDRYSVLYYGWEQIASCLIFVSMFLPIGEHYTLFRLKNSSIPDKFRSPFTYLLLIQISLIYFYNGVSKNGDLWIDGSASGFAVGSLDKNYGLADWFSEKTTLVKVTTWLTLAWELLFPLLVFLPWKNDRLRMLAALSILAFHWGISTMIDVGNFRIVAIPMAMVLFPPSFWAALRRKLKGRYLKNFPKKLPGLVFTTPVLIKRFVAGFLIFFMVMSNLSQSLNSKTPDRFKQWMEGNAIGSIVGEFDVHDYPTYTFFAQFWHLYSPNPPRELGYAQIELITTESDTLTVFNGKEIEAHHFPSRIVKFMHYTLLYGIRNRKDFSMMYCLLNREMRIWAAERPKMRLSKVQLCHYSRKPESLKELQTLNDTPPERTVFLELNIK